MAIHPELPESPYAVLNPDHRWFPAAEELREKSYEKLLPPLVAKVRREVKAWRDSGYAGMGWDAGVEFGALMQRPGPGAAKAANCCVRNSKVTA